MAKQDDISGLIESWMHGQQKIWSDWMGVVGKGGGDGDVWQQGLQRWREAMEATLDAQSQAMKSWMEQAGRSEAGSPQSRQWTAQGMTMLEQWTAAQRSLWDQWFAMMGKVAQTGAAQPGTNQLNQYLAGWEQVSQQMRALQEQWAASMAGGKKGTSAKKK